MNLNHLNLVWGEQLLPELAGPIVLYNKSHSGSRLLTTLLEAAGVFMGAHQNESKDSLDVLELVTYLVDRYYPDYSPLWDPRTFDDGILPGLIRRVFERHLQGFDSSGQGLWGWKLCDTTYIVPVVDFLFPRARFIHLIRDGRDVAFCDHRGPDNPFWKKVYFNTERISHWRGLKLDSKSYRRKSHIFNTIHWVNSVTVGRNYGMMLRERHLEVRYEDLCMDFPNSARRVLEFIGAVAYPTVVETLQPRVYSSSVHKHLRHSRRKLREVVEIAKPLLLSLGYLERD